MTEGNSGAYYQPPPAPPRRPDSNRGAILGIVIVLGTLLAALAFMAWNLGWFSGLNPFSRRVTPVETTIEPSASSGNTQTERYEWTYGGQTYYLTMSIPESLYLYYSQMERAPVEDYSIYVTHPKDDAPLTGPLAAEMKKLAGNRGSVDTVNFVASFVQSFRYELDKEGEYPNYPVETLVEKYGDCEDTAILAAALLNAMGYDAVLIRYTSTVEGEAGHMAIGVAVPGASGDHYDLDGKAYYYLETTASTWKLGVMPDNVRSDYGGKNDGMYRLVAAPALKFSDQLEYSIDRRWLREATIDLSVSITNWGTAAADDFYVKAFIEGRESGAKVSSSYDLGSGYRISGVTIEGLALPSGTSQLHVQLCCGTEICDSWDMEVS